MDLTGFSVTDDSIIATTKSLFANRCRVTLTEQEANEAVMSLETFFDTLVAWTSEEGSAGAGSPP